MRLTLYIFLLITIFTSCRKMVTDEKEEFTFEYAFPEYFPSIELPSNNLPSPERILLGKKLFFDTRLSEDGTISCGTCHIQSLAFSDGKKVSEGIKGRKGNRNAPGLFNLAYHPDMFWDGGVPTMELQVIAPIEDVNEMNFNVLDVVERLKDDTDYQSMCKDAYNTTLGAVEIVNAIAAFERSLISGNSSFDQYFYKGNDNAISEDAKAGFDVFLDLECDECHELPLFSSFEYSNIGLYQNYNDPGRARITLNALDSGKFKIPSLRNVELTAPYFHDGSVLNLSEAIDKILSGGANHNSKSDLIIKKTLTTIQKRQLETFLLSLTDEDFINNTEFTP